MDSVPDGPESGRGGRILAKNHPYVRHGWAYLAILCTLGWCSLDSRVGALIPGTFLQMCTLFLRKRTIWAYLAREAAQAPAGADGLAFAFGMLTNVFIIITL